MTRTHEPERVDRAWRAGIRNRLIRNGIPERWFDAWLHEAEATAAPPHPAEWWIGLHNRVARAFAAGQRPSGL